MKKYIMYLLTAAILITLPACGMGNSGTSPAQTSTQAASPSPSPDKPVVEFLADNPTAAAVGGYLTRNASKLLPADGDQLLERLFLLQLDAELDMNRKLADSKYLTVLSTVMKDGFDAKKISKISDKTIRDDYQAMADGLMTISFEEGAPDVCPNWEALSQLDTAFDTQAAFVIEHRARYQGTYYSDPAKGLNLLAQDIVAVEKQFSQTQKAFVRWQLHGLYIRLTAALLYGPEGKYLSALAVGNQEVVQRLMSYAVSYENTRFGTLCNGLLSLGTTDQQALSQLVIAATVFTPDDPRTVQIQQRTLSKAQISVPKLSDGSNSELLQQISSAIEEEAAAMLGTGRLKQKIYTTTAATGYYLSVTLSYSYTDSSNRSFSTEKNLVFDLATGKAVTLEELTGKSFDVEKPVLLKAAKGDAPLGDISEPLSYSLNNSGIVLAILPQTGTYPDHYAVTLNSLRALMDISKLY